MTVKRMVGGEVVQYQDTYRLCYIRGPEGILIGLAQELGQQSVLNGSIVRRPEL